MHATQDPKHNAIPPRPPDSKPVGPIETQRRYRLRIKRELEALREIRAIIARLDGDS